MPGYASSIQIINAAIANGGTTSQEIDCGFTRAARLSLPAAFTGTSISFLVPSAADPTVYQPLYTSADVLVAITVTQGREYVLDWTVMRSMQKFKIVSNAAEAGDRLVGCILEPSM